MFTHEAIYLDSFNPKSVQVTPIKALGQWLINPYIALWFSISGSLNSNAFHLSLFDRLREQALVSIVFITIVFTWHFYVLFFVDVIVICI